MPTTNVYPDVMADFKVWLQTHPKLTPVIGSRVFFQVPTKGDKIAVSGWPFLRIYTVLEQPDMAGEIQWVTETISIEMWGKSGSDWPVLRELKNLINQAVMDLGLGGSTRINPAGSTVTLDATITHWLDDVDPETGIPRIVGNASLDVVGVAVG